VWGLCNVRLVTRPRSIESTGTRRDGGRRGGRRRWASSACLILVLALIAGVAALTVDSPKVGAVDEVMRTRPQNGPLGAITVIGDSVLVGSLAWGPTLDDHLAAAGWGPIRVRAGVGDNTGAFGARTTTKASYWIQTWRSQGWDAPAVVVNLGANDAVVCDGNAQCAYEAIMHLVNVIGPGKRVWWPKITHHPVVAHRHIAWNQALDRVAAERPGSFFTWDWPTVMYQLGMYSSDHIHQTAPGYRVRSQLMSNEITASLARGSQTGGPAPLPAPASEPREMLPVGPTRVLDTRRQPPGRLTAGRVVEVDVSAYVPDATTAVAAYITAAGPSAAGHLSAQPCASAPSSSITNYSAGTTRGAVTISPVSADKKFCVFTHAATDLVIDLQAAFVPEGLRFTPIPSPQRLLDTRRTGASQHLEIPVPVGAAAVAMNVTAVMAASPGHVTIHPCVAPVPTASNLNYRAREVVASAAYVPVSAAGTVCIDTHTLVDLVVDLTGVFEPGGDLAFVPAVPTRMLDTRRGIGGWTPLHGSGQTIEATVAPPAAQAVTGTMTLVSPFRNSHLQAWACGGRDENSNVNALAGATLANFVTTGTSSGKLCIFAVNAGHTLFDTTGWWIP
jgi:hypothetical protein